MASGWSLLRKKKKTEINFVFLNVRNLNFAKITTVHFTDLSTKLKTSCKKYNNFKEKRSQFL